MKQSLFVTLAILILSINGHASTLESLLNSQITQEISPVVVEGKHFSGDPASAGGVCKALGYSRLVSFITESCEPREQLYTFTSSACNSASRIEQFKSGVWCPAGRLSLVVCAK